MTPQDVIKAAQSKIGTVEKGGKDGKSGNIVEFWDWWKKVTKENDQGASWCAVFVSWCFAQAQASSLIPVKNKFGFIYCPDGVNWFSKKKQLVPPKNAQPGDILFFDWDGKGVADHVGLVIENHKTYLTTIEGNTSAEGVAGSQQNGGGVYQRKRYLDKTIMAVARPAYPTIK
jgi:cell wall-associated NlpC family hydrolase